MKRNMKLIFVLIIVLMQIILISNIVNATWWDANWIYKQEINLTSTIATPQNFTTNIILNSSNVGSGFNWNNECNNNRTKIRIIDSTESFELPIFVQECSQTNQNMSLWVKIEQSITTTGTSVYAYYGNNLASSISDPENTFDFYVNLSTMTMASESSGSSQDISGNGVVLDSGRTFYTWGNSWKVFNNINPFSFTNTGTQILEVDMLANDCGEIVATKFDTNRAQEDNFNYRWCGSQTNWGIVPDRQYTNLGNWQRVYAILNDFTITNPTHIHLPVDDDADASSDVYFKDIRVRKYVGSEPNFSIKEVEVINTTVQSLSPIDNITTNNVSITFTCAAATTNSTNLKNMSLYANWGSGWHLNETKTLSGQINSTTFTKTFNENSANYLWNCLVYDEAGFSDWFDINYTINIDKQLPQITINNPIIVNQDFTPRLNISFDKNVNAWYNINGSTNISLCDNCISSFNKSLYLAEGNYVLNVFANDSIGNSNSTSLAFEVNMDKKYVENFNDDFSIENLNGNQVGGGNLTYSGAVQMYNGIEIGIVSNNFILHPNQWGGNGNAGEVDITCTGGDSNCWFETQDGTNISTPTIINGVTTLDSDSSTVGFIMYSATDVHTRWPGTHPQNSNHYAAVCYNSGQWYYEDNNGCTNAFTPAPTDIIIANLTWGITSVSEIIKGAAGNAEVLIKQLNLTHNITMIENISWNSFNTGANNNVSINISLDQGHTWHNTTNGFGISNITQNNSLLVKVIFNSDGSLNPGLYNFSIKWDNIVKEKPVVNITNPINNSKILGSLVNLTWEIEDNEINLNCSIYIDSIFNQTTNCTTASINSLIFNLSRGLYDIYIRVNDSENYSSISNTNYFTIIDEYGVSLEKKISVENSNLYRIQIIGSKIIDFVTSLFTSGSYSTIYDWRNISSQGEYLGWNNSVNYSISGVGNYSMRKNYIIGID